MRRKLLFSWGMLVFMAANWPLQLISPSPKIKEQIQTYRILTEEICLKVVQDSSLYIEKWDTLVQPTFWRMAMQLPPDSILINIASTREIVGRMSLPFWVMKSDRAKRKFEDSVKTAHGLKKRDEIYFTTGRSHFYKFEQSLRSIDRAVDVFQEEQTDPWYAQAILLIESPGRLQFSTDGAYGAFQLMESVAREVGLVVNDKVDEREDFSKSARGAARLIQRVCIPHAKEICRTWRLPYRETDIWFRLLVMHVYHAGAKNVKRVVRKIRPKTGGMSLITEMWQTKSRRFGNASQNYSQITLAAMVEFDQIIARKGIICPIEPNVTP